MDRKGLACLENGETDREPLLGDFLLECSTLACSIRSVVSAGSMTPVGPHFNKPSGAGTTRLDEENRPKVESDTKAWEPALHARARQVVRGGELGT